MSWAESGRAWGERAADWAYLAEPYARRVNDALFDRAQVGPGTALLDIACGSGYAANVAAGRGAEVSGLDASEALIAIARARTPAGDFRVGDMFALPFEDGHFAVATSFNGIWKGCEGALAEARRVVRPGGLVGFQLLGIPQTPGPAAVLRGLGRTVAGRSPRRHPQPGRHRAARRGRADARRRRPGVRRPGEGTGHQQVPRPRPGPPGADSGRPSWPALHHVGQDRFDQAMREALSPLYAEGLGVRIISEYGWVIGTVPSA